MTFLDFFAGIGTIRIGFEQAGWTCNGHVEWDKFAQASYNAMHDIKEGEFCGWDIREVRADELPQSDLWTFGAPCQDFSIAGKRKGMDGERSSLIREIFRLIEETKEENRPTWLLYENVKGMLSSNGGRDFLGIITEMAELGYDVEWQLLNSKDWGVPQNRERVFTLGHLRGRGGRKVFPITGQGGQTNQTVIGNVSNTGHDGENVYSTDGTAPTLKARGYKGPVMVGLDKTLDNPRVIEVANCLTAREDRGLSNRKAEGTMVAIREATKKGYAIAEPGDSINLEQPNSKTRRGRVGKGVANTLTTGCQQGVLVEPKIIDDQGRVKDEYKQHDIVPCLRAQTHGNPPKVTIPVLTPDRVEKRQNGRRFKEDGDPMFTLTAQDRHGVAIMRPKRTDYGKQIRKQYEAGEVKESRHNMTTLEPVFDGVSNTITTVQKDNLLLDNQQGMRIRKLTPRECWRLQGIPDHYFDKASAVNSNSQLYKQAGNACTVNVIYEIAKRI